MIHFIVVEDNKYHRELVTNTITKVMMKNDFAYKIFSFKDYNEEFYDILNFNLCNKVYLLDIKTATEDGISVARQIRKNDIQSLLIFMTAYTEQYAEAILKANFMFYAFLNKREDFELTLLETISSCLKIIDRNDNIRFKENNCTYTFSKQDIIYITADTEKQKTLIVLDANQLWVQQSLTELENLLKDSSLIRTHRSWIINFKRIYKIEHATRTITFDNGMQINGISTRFLKEHPDLNLNEVTST